MALGKKDSKLGQPSNHQENSEE